MDTKHTSSNTAKDWLQLVCDLHIYPHIFSCLPEDVQARIFAQAHPRQSIDCYLQDDLICVQQITVPHKIASWHAKEDNLVYFSEQRRDTTTPNIRVFDLHHVDLVHGTDTLILSENTVVHGEVPQLALCGNAVIFERVLKTLGVLDLDVALRPNPWRSKRKPECYLLVDDGGRTGGTRCAYKNCSFACHSQLPLCAVIDKECVVRVYNIEKVEPDIIERFDAHLRDIVHIAWHPTLPIIATAAPASYLRVSVIKYESQQFDKYDSCFLWGTQGRVETLPCFSYEGDLIVAGNNKKIHKAVLNKYGFNLDAEFKIRHGGDICAMGESYFLTDDTSKTDSEKSLFTLRALDSDEQKEITSLQGYKKGWYRLPQNNDYRFFTVTKGRGVISVYVPNSKACIAHYCMFNAALAAQKENTPEVWNHRKKIPKTYW